MGLKILGSMILKGQLKAFTSSGTTTTTTTAAPTTTTTTTTTTTAPLIDPYCVSGAGLTTVNGTYTYVAGPRSPHSGSGRWEKVGDDNIRMGYTPIRAEYTITQGSSFPSNIKYTAASLTSSWSIWGGAAPAPTVVSGECGTATTTTTAAPTTTTTTTAAPTTTTTTTTTAAPNTMILSVNSTPRALVGGGVTYDPTFINSDYRQYFTSVNNNLNNRILNGYLPLQNTLSSSYSYTDSSNALPTFIFDFRIPTVITKYRMWNGFMANIGVYQKYSDLGNQTPQAWSLQGSNDEISWTTVDTRTSQDMLPYASTNDPATSSYSEFEISSPAAYKSYRLVLSARGRTGWNCFKTGCSYDTQLGEVQLWGYEDPTTSCALHGYNTLLPTAKYYTSAGVLTNTDPFSSAFNMGTVLSISNTIAAWTTAKNNAAAFYVASGGTKDGYIGFDYPMTLTSYKLWGGSGTASIGYAVNTSTTYSFRVYGANTFGTWTLLDTRTLATIGSAATFTITSPALYSYYKISIFNSSVNVSAKSGGGFVGLIKDIQLQGYLT